MRPPDPNTGRGQKRRLVSEEPLAPVGYTVGLVAVPYFTFRMYISFETMAGWQE